MPYSLGIDLGTTYSAAAIASADTARILQLGTRIASIPSTVALRDDGTILTGEAAERRARQDPARAAREFKRRLGDTTPILLGGTPFGAESLTAHLLRSIVATVTEREGEAPQVVVLSHPANYGPYKLDMMREAARLADVPAALGVTEPEAAAVHYASDRPPVEGAVILVYDFGGGTFDASLVRRNPTGFELLGTPEGMERFGGIDLDAAVLAHVRGHVGSALDDLDPTDPDSLTIMERLREECRIAKETLSEDNEATITAMLPGGPRPVRLLRSEFEDMIRPRLMDTLAAARRTIAGAGLEPDEVSEVLLVGGSSRIPLVGELVRSELGVTVAMDVHPKHVVALGAARFGLTATATEAAAPETLTEPTAPETVADATLPWEDIQAALRDLEE